jgi:hypothetical protein
LQRSKLISGKFPAWRGQSDAIDSFSHAGDFDGPEAVSGRSGIHAACCPYH